MIIQRKAWSHPVVVILRGLHIMVWINQDYVKDPIFIKETDNAAIGH